MGEQERRVRVLECKSENRRGRKREREKVFVDAIEGAKSKQHEWHLNKGVTKGWCGGLFIRAAVAMLCSIRSKTSTSFDGLSIKVV